MSLHSHDIRSNPIDNTLSRASTPIAPGNAQASVPLSDFASSYSNGAFIADIVSPIAPTDDITGTYYKFAQKDATTLYSNHVGERGSINEISLDLTTAAYTCIGYGLRGPVSLQLQNVADPAVQPKRRMTQKVMDANLLSRERRIATQITTSGNWASGSTGAATALWSNQTTGVPLTDIHTAIAAIPASNGASRKVGVCALEVFHALQSHPQIRDLHGTAQGQISAEALADYLMLDQLLVSEAQYNTANTGQTVVAARVWLATVFAIVLVANDASDPLNTECFSKTFRRRMSGAGGGGMLVREWHEAGSGTEGVDHVAVTHEDDEVIPRNDAGYLITSVL